MPSASAVIATSIGSSVAISLKILISGIFGMACIIGHLLSRAACLFEMPLADLIRLSVLLRVAFMMIMAGAVMLASGF